MTVGLLPCIKSLPIGAVIILSLGACVLGPVADPGPDRVIKAYYARHATEENGKCRAPRIDTIQSHQPKSYLESGIEVVTIRYSYYDRHADMDANWGALFHLAQPCGGIAERDFSLIRTNLGYRITDMKGERREGVSSN